MLCHQTLSAMTGRLSKPGTACKHSNKLLTQYTILCVVNGVESANVKCPASNSSVLLAGGAVFSCLETMVEFQYCLTEVVQLHAGSSNKAKDAADFFNGWKMLPYAKAVLLL